MYVGVHDAEKLAFCELKRTIMVRPESLWGRILQYFYGIWKMSHGEWQLLGNILREYDLEGGRIGKACKVSENLADQISLAMTDNRNRYHNWQDTELPGSQTSKRRSSSKFAAKGCAIEGCSCGWWCNVPRRWASRRSAN